MQNYDYSLLSAAEHDELKPFLAKAFQAFKPRSAFIGDADSNEKIKKLTLAVEEEPNIVMKDTHFHKYPNHEIPEFKQVFAGYSQFAKLNQKLDDIEKYVSQFITGCQATFITFSTNMTGAGLGVEHLHPIMNKDRCNVWSFCIPLYIDQDETVAHKFCYEWNDNLFPPRYYVDYARLKKTPRQYSAFEMPKNGKIFSIQFDGARCPHYIDYTKHLYAWFVFDGVDYKDNARPFKSFVIDYL